MPKSSLTYENLEQVHQAGIRATDLVRQILTFSRRTEQERRPTRLSSVIEEALKLLRGSLPSTIEIQQSVNSECGAVLADATQIHQVIMNLCTNAYHAMAEEGGVLRIALEEIHVENEREGKYPVLKKGKYARLSVSDTGHGMDLETKERIFEPFFTTKDKDKGEGTGLGLSTIHGIVQNHDGAITVDSEVGKGATFHVFIPLCRNLGKTAEESGAATPLPTGHERILFVDDEESIVLMEKMSLERLGYEVTAFTDSLEALEVFCSAPGAFDVVVTDQMMPKLTGYDLAIQILEIRRDIPVILCSGFSEAASEEKAEKIGIRKYLTKPILKNELASAIREISGVSEVGIM